MHLNKILTKKKVICESFYGKDLSSVTQAFLYLVCHFTLQNISS